MILSIMFERIEVFILLSESRSKRVELVRRFRQLFFIWRFGYCSTALIGWSGLLRFRVSTMDQSKNMGLHGTTWNYMGPKQGP